MPGAIDGLRPDGSLVQTVLHVLGSDRLLQTALAAAKPNDPSRYSIKATVQPGSAFFDQEVDGPDAQAGQAIARSLNVADATYIGSAYSAYSLDVVGTDVSTHDSFPPKPAVALLVLLARSRVRFGNRVRRLVVPRTAAGERAEACGPSRRARDARGRGRGVRTARSP